MNLLKKFWRGLKRIYARGYNIILFILTYAMVKEKFLKAHEHTLEAIEADTEKKFYSMVREALILLKNGVEKDPTFIPDLEEIFHRYKGGDNLFKKISTEIETITKERE